jgi:hypothetical protein
MDKTVSLSGWPEIQASNSLALIDTCSVVI